MQDVFPSRAILRFSDFEVDLRAGELRKLGVRVKLQEQPFQILEVLLEHPGEVVTREELQRRIWPSDTFVDFNQGLYNAIKRLREALGDASDTPRFIETLPKRGYRFIGELNGSGVGSASVQAPPVMAQPPPMPEGAPGVFVPTKRRWLRVLSGVLAAVAMVAMLLSAVPGGIASNLWRWFPSGTSVPAIHSLAVLPLQNLSADPAQEYSESIASLPTSSLVFSLSQYSLSPEGVPPLVEC